MKETSEIVDPLILESLNSIKESNKELHDFLIDIPAFQKRIKKKEKLRPFLLRLAYELVGGKDWEKVAYVCASIELLNISTYIDNAVFDDKNNITEKEKTNYIICARIIRDVAEDILEQSSNRYKNRLMELVREIDKYIYIAQFEDANQLNDYNSFDNFEIYLKRYLHRCEWLTGKFMGDICKIGAILANGIEEQIKDLGEIGKNIGIIVQIINDVGDFVSPEEKVYDYEKVYQDQFSDIKHGKLTLPVYYSLRHSSELEKEKIKKVFGNRQSKNEEIVEVVKILVKVGAIEYAKNLASEYTKKTKVLLKQFDKSDARDQLNILTIMSKTNKYLAKIKERFGEVKIRKEYLVLVDDNDKPIGIEEKMKVHEEGKLHRAFSVFIFNSKGELLIQKRAISKYHSGGLWSNTVCGHPRPDESTSKAPHRRLVEEMDFDCPLKRAFKFQYRVTFENGLVENEIDHVFIGEYNGEVKVNKEEVSDYKWISLTKLKREFIENSNQYTVWLKIAIKKYGEEPEFIKVFVSEDILSATGV